MKLTKRGYRIFGTLLILVGLFMLFKAATVSHFGFYRFGNVSTGGILIVLFVIALVAAFVNPNKWTKLIVLITLILLALSIILALRISFYGISLVDVLLMVIPIALGIGFIIKGHYTED